MIYKTSSAEETQKVAFELAKKYQSGVIIALSGPLGAGKTTFTQGFAQGLGIREKLISPTFIIMRQYEIPMNNEGRLYHIDLYRLEKLNQLEELGLSEIFENPKNIILIEWAEKLGETLPKQTVKIQIKQHSENNREIIVED